MLNSFVYSNFNYCPLVWHFCSTKSVKKISKNYKNGLLEYFTTTFPVILNKSGKSTMEKKRLRIVALEVLKTLNDMNPEYMNEIFQKTVFTTHKPLNLEVNENHKTRYGNKNLRRLQYLTKYLRLTLVFM